LGVDTVKQAEVFAAVREEYALERDDNLQLRDFPTLNHVAGWVRERAGIAAPAAAAPAAAAAAAPSVATPAPAAAPEASEASSSGLAAATDGDPVLASVTRIVAELTGYPTELLDPDLDLEADLGVDTVKQAEVFAAVREEYNLERDDNLQLRDFPTLNHVAGWVRERAGIGAGAPAAEATSSLGSAATAPTADLIAGDLGAIDALPRRIPCPTLRPSLGQCVETGVNLDGSRVLVMLDEGGVGQALVKKLKRSGASVLTLDVGVSTEELSARLDEWLADGPISGVYWLPALDDDGDLASYDLAQWQEALRRRVKALYTTMRRMWDTSPFLVSATRLGGYHGYDIGGATSVLGGAVTGFTKSYKKERPYALVKAVDLPPSRKTAMVADILLEETLLDPGAVEIGRAEDKRFGVAFTEQPFPALAGDGSCQGDSGIVLRPDSVFLITGAAGSIVSAITADLAKAAGGGTFHLLDLAPEPQAGDADIAAFRTDKDALKATLAARMKEAGERPTPVAIDRVLAGLERKSAALAGIEAIAAAGGTCHYYSVNLTDAEAVGAVMEQVTSTSGRIDVLLHAAGLEISRDLPQKEPSEYDLVFDVKINGWFNVWKAAQTMDVGATVAFSSVAGRFGNQGQTDYAAANDLLCKITSNMRRNRPQTRALATDWTAWGGIGMATRGSIPKIMEAAGVQMLPPEAGVAWIRRELTSWDFSGEIIVAGVLGMMAAEIHESGGMDVGAVLGNRQNGPMTDHVTLSTIYGVVNTVTLDPKEQPFLYDHRIDGTALLPGVMGMESFAETASLIAPAGYRIGAVEGVGFNAPVKFFRDEPRTLRITAVTTPDPAGGSDLIAHCQLSGQRNLPGRDKPEVTVHFTGTVRLTQEPVAEEREEVSLEFGERQVGKDTIYTFYFHGPAYQVIGNAARFADGSMTRMEDNLPDNHIPRDRPTLNAPRLAELCFQTAGLWEAGREQRMALPLKVDRVRVLRDPATVEGALFGLARQVGEGLFDCAIVDSGGSVVVRMDGYGTISVPSGIPEEVAGALKHTYGDE
ncbi:MAG TPA: SDR family NAD(P)-dependent oxidoreductase, partial [Dermatophilaceae bacterium]|nr:SDR family NAD(P)-dependent oxidoreductase [Dermatophilaceae bacterium]